MSWPAPPDTSELCCVIYLPHWLEMVLYLLLHSSAVLSDLKNTIWEFRLKNNKHSLHDCTQVITFNPGPHKKHQGWETCFETEHNIKLAVLK